MNKVFKSLIFFSFLLVPFFLSGKNILLINNTNSFDSFKVYYLEKHMLNSKIEILKENNVYLKIDMELFFIIFILTIVSISTILVFLILLKNNEKIYFYYFAYNILLFIYFSIIYNLSIFVTSEKYIYNFELTIIVSIGFLILFVKENIKTKKYLLNHPEITYYIFSIMIYFLFLILFILMINGILENSYIIRYGFMICIIIEIFFFYYIFIIRCFLIKKRIQSLLEKKIAKNIYKLKEKELFLKELNHRVKNNFHMIISMLWIEGKKTIFSEENINILTHRIECISMIHESLYKNKNLKKVNLKFYLEKIITNILYGYDISTKIEIYLKDLNIKYDVAMSLGIIVNEVLHNVLKHNKNKKNLILRISLKSDEFNNFALIISDNGGWKGKKKSSSGLGLQLIEQFCGKIPNSRYEFIFSNDTTFKLEFRL
jgi:two-component sensor histidine kinase